MKLTPDVYLLSEYPVILGICTARGYYYCVTFITDNITVVYYSYNHHKPLNWYSCCISNFQYTNCISPLYLASEYIYQLKFIKLTINMLFRKHRLWARTVHTFSWSLWLLLSYILWKTSITLLSHYWPFVLILSSITHINEKVSNAVIHWVITPLSFYIFHLLFGHQWSNMTILIVLSNVYDTLHTSFGRWQLFWK